MLRQPHKHKNHLQPPPVSTLKTTNPKGKVDPFYPFGSLLQKCLNDAFGKHKVKAKDDMNSVRGRRSYRLKQNCGPNEATPKLQEEEVNSIDMDQFSQIKFMSKECSSIKQACNPLDSSPDGLSYNNLESFSPLFDTASHRDDILIFAEQSNQDMETARLDNPLIQTQVFNKVAKGGKIRKNILKSTSQSQNLQLEQAIIDIFKQLNANGDGKLSKENCHSEALSTELNYLIGSILAKIRKQNLTYDLTAFTAEFKALTLQIQQKQLFQILQNNRKLQQTSSVSSCLSSKPTKTVLSFESKIDKIRDKISSHLAKKNAFSQQEHQSLHQTPLASSRQKQFAEQKEERSSFNSTNKNSLKSEYSLRNQYELIRGAQGQSFSLVFTELNKHLI